MLTIEKLDVAGFLTYGLQDKTTTGGNLRPLLNYGYLQTNDNADLETYGWTFFLNILKNRVCFQHMLNKIPLAPPCPEEGV